MNEMNRSLDEGDSQPAASWWSDFMRSCLVWSGPKCEPIHDKDRALLVDCT